MKTVTLFLANQHAVLQGWVAQPSPLPGTTNMVAI